MQANYYKSVAELGTYLVSKLKRAYPKTVLNFEYDQFTRQASFKSSTFSSDHACVAFATNSNYLNRVLGITENAEMKDRQMTLTFIPNTSTQPPLLENPGAMFIYSDIVKYQMVSDTQVPVMGIVPSDGEHADRRTFVFNPAIYIPLATDELDTIEIDIRTPQGIYFPFWPESNVMVRLDVRPQLVYQSSKSEFFRLRFQDGESNKCLSWTFQSTSGCRKFSSFQS